MLLQGPFVDAAELVHKEAVHSAVEVMFGHQRTLHFLCTMLPLQMMCPFRCIWLASDVAVFHYPLQHTSTTSKGRRNGVG
jgi:hypothetical protein